MKARRIEAMVPGEIYGECRVLEWLGVVGGCSRVRVVHTPTGRESVATVGDLISGKFTGRGQGGPHAGRRPMSAAPGDVLGENRVVEYLGVVDGFSRVRVVHVPTGRESTVPLHTLRSGKFSGRGKAGSNATTLERYGAARTRPGTVAKKRLSKKTFGELRARMAAYGVRLVVDPIYGDPDSPVYPNRTEAAIGYTCHCGNTGKARFDALWWFNTKSCGCDKSKTQSDLFGYIQSLCPDAVQNDRTAIAPLELDVLVPSKKIAVEFHGLHWHGEGTVTDKLLKRGMPEAAARRQARYGTARKRALCAAAGVRLVVVFSDEWVGRRSAVEDRLRSIMGCSAGPRTGAREMSVSGAPAPEARAFLGAHHMQGACRSSVYLGARSADGALRAVMSFSRPNSSRASAGKYGWELARFASDGGTYPGLASRMLTRFAAAHPADSIVSYSDNRWSDGGLYRTLGFSMVSPGTPSYWYFKGHGWGERFHRYTFRKSAALKRFGGLPSETEWQVMRRAGYDRVWDCGSAAWVLPPRA